MDIFPLFFTSSGWRRLIGLSSITLFIGTLPTNVQAKDQMVLKQTDKLSVRGHFQVGFNAVSESNLFWNFADTFASDAGFDSDANWLELYLKPGLSFSKSLKNKDSLYGKLSLVSSYTAGTDAFDAADTGRTTLEEAYLGYKTNLTEDTTLDLSLGPRELKLGTGMLLANGGSSGFERGALKFGPRKAWDEAAIATLSDTGRTAKLFYISPNELSSNDSGNKLAGLDLRYDAPQGGYLGLSYIKVLDSRAPYPQAAPGGIGPPTITPGARDGLNALNFYAKTKPSSGPFRKLTLATDLAYEKNDNIDMRAWAGRFQVGYAFSEHVRSPTLTYSYQVFSGDDPDTERLERFDPLYYEGSPSAWATGSKSSMVFINSNVQAHGLALRTQPTKKDTVTLRYTHIRAHELRSPIQFGQATRIDFSDNIPSVISGVTDAHLSDDFFIEYNRIINRNTFLNAGLSISLPGKGNRNLVDGSIPNWTGGFLNVVINY